MSRAEDAITRNTPSNDFQFTDSERAALRRAFKMKAANRVDATDDESAYSDIEITLGPKSHLKGSRQTDQK